MQPLPLDLVRFAATNVPTLNDLQALVLFVESRDRWFDARSVARLLSITLPAARGALDNLARGNLLDIRLTDDVRYRFCPGTAELERRAKALVEVYRRNPQQVIQLIH